jgi:predicted Zn-dependent peptidase
MNATRTLTVATALVALSALPPARAAAQAPPGQAPPSKGVVVKGKAPVSNEILKVTLPRPQEADLPNGIHLMIIEDHRAPQISMQMSIQGAGGFFDPADAPGLAVFTAAMMSEGTAARTSQQIAQDLEAMASAVSVNTGATSEFAVVMASSLTDTFDRTLDLAADIVLNPTFPEAELARDKTRQKAQLVQVRAMPQFLAAERYGRVMYGDHPAGRVMATSDAIDKAVGEILNEVKRARTEPIPDREFVDRKRSLVANFALSLETPSAILNNYVTSRRYTLPADYWDKYPERLMAITKKQVQAAAVKYLDPARLQIVAVGDSKKIGEGLKTFGTVEVYDADGRRKTP